MTCTCTTRERPTYFSATKGITYERCNDCGLPLDTPEYRSIKRKPYDALCDGEDCFMVVKEADIERNANGDIYERSKKCHKCRTPADDAAIKRWRKKQRRREREKSKG